MPTVRFELPPFDIDGDGNAESLVFEYSDNLTITHSTRTGYLTGENGSTSTIIDILTDLIGDVSDVDIDRQGRRQSLFTDLGGGTRVVETRGDTVTSDGEHQWGTGNGGKWDATGEDALTKIQLLDEALTLAEIDSRPADGNYPEGHLATLEVGQFSDNGRWDPLGVVPEQPQGTAEFEQRSSAATIDINYVAAVSLDIAFDATKQTEA